MRIVPLLAILVLAMVPPAGAYLMDVEILPDDPVVKDAVIARIHGGFGHRDRLLGHRVLRSGRDVRVYVIVSHLPPGHVELPDGYALDAELGTFAAGEHEVCVCEPLGNPFAGPPDDPDPDDRIDHWVVFRDADPCDGDGVPDMDRPDRLVRRLTFTVREVAPVTATWTAIKGLYD